MRKPDNAGFSKNKDKLGLQYGDDFERRCFRHRKFAYFLSILQFVKASQIVGNQLGEKTENIYIDKEQVSERTNLKYMKISGK